MIPGPACHRAAPKCAAKAAGEDESVPSLRARQHNHAVHVVEDKLRHAGLGLVQDFVQYFPAVFQPLVFSFVIIAHRHQRQRNHRHDHQYCSRFAHHFTSHNLRNVTTVRGRED